MAEAETTKGELNSNPAARDLARVAAGLFARHGYDATSVREIVEAAGVTKPTLYYYFGSKQGLVEAVLTKPMNDFVARLRELIDREADPVRLLRGFFATQIDFLAEAPDRARFIYALCF